MNFFEHQDAAKKKTGLLIALLVGAVACLIVITILVVGVFLYYLGSHSTSVSAYQAQQLPLIEHFWHLLGSPIAAWVSLGVLAVVAVGCGYKFVQLGGGGKAVATSLGGRLIDPSSRDPLERKILNIVEEMAIASGNPVPPVYLIDDESINAFAAGLQRRDAVIGVTHGCIKLLSRDELQGVIAHEFSHIHNGDMRLNMRLIAILHGILLIGLIGYYIAHGSGHRSYHSYRRRRDNKQASLGLALMAIGYGGTFFGNIIKAAVSRQREFLADASAVQFTRNPLGISGALKKIGGFSKGSAMTSGNAAEFSHMYFGQGVVNMFGSLMATHPPLKDRIKRIDPRWVGQFPSVVDEPVYDATSADEKAPISNFAPTTDKTPTVNESVIDIIGESSPESIRYADYLIDGLPNELHKAAQQAFSARAIIYGLLLDTDITIRDKQLEQLQTSAHPVTFKALLGLIPSLKSIARDAQLTLLNLSMPALKQLSTRQYEVFRKNLAMLIKADQKVTFFEWSLYRITVKNVEAKDIKGQTSLSTSKAHVLTLLHVVSIAGKNDDPLKALNKGLAALDSPLLTQLPKDKFSLPKLDRALDELEKLKPLEKPKLLKALLKVIHADTRVTIEEKQLFRAVADTLNCPVPPFD